MGLKQVALAAGVLTVAGAGFGLAHSDLSPLSVTETVTTPTMGCNDWPVTLTQGECFAAGTIRYVALYNLQGAAQFCKWRSANPGEWLRLQDYAASGIPPQNIVTWFAGAIRNQIEAYLATGAPPFIISPNTSPNVCRTPLPPPTVQGVTPGQTDATVTIGG